MILQFLSKIHFSGRQVTLSFLLQSQRKKPNFCPNLVFCLSWAPKYPLFGMFSREISYFGRQVPPFPEPGREVPPFPKLGREVPPYPKLEFKSIG